MARRKIAYLLTPVEFGGAERVSLNFLKNADRDRFDFYPILLVRPWEEENYFTQALRDQGFPIFKAPVARHPSGVRRDYFRVLRSHLVVRSLLRENSCELLHTHGYFANIIGIPAAKMIGIPTVSTCHGFISNEKKLRLYNRLDRLVLRFSDRIIAVSEGIKNDLVDSGIEASRIEVIANGVETEFSPSMLLEKRARKRKQLDIGERAFVIGYTGRLSKEKAIDCLLRAAAMLVALDVPVKILIVGEGPERGDLENLVRHECLSDQVVFCGFQTEIADWIPAFDLFVLPSLTEGTPMSALEAMACGVPVIASAVGGVPQMIDSWKNGVLVPPGRPEEIRDAILTLYRSPSLRERLSVAAREGARAKYSMGSWTKRIEKKYREMLHRN